jgi:hypothetical protein
MLEGNFGKKFILTVFVFSALFLAQAQENNTVNGPQCVLPGLVYQYNVKAVTKENEKVKLCIENGILLTGNSACIEAISLPFVRVQWQEGKTAGKITVSSQAGKAELAVNISAPLNPGTIGTTDRQTVNFNTAAPSLSCTPASGGNCSPSFTYQWERSPDKVQWIAIAAGTTSNLSISARLDRTTYFRRKVIETRSQAVGYSNEITVFVSAQSRPK